MNPTISGRKPGQPGPKGPFEDQIAAARIRDMREERGLHQNTLAKAIQRMAAEKGWDKPGGPGAISEDTVASIEAGHYPSLPKQLVLSLFFECRIRDIWEPQNKRSVLHGDLRAAA